MSDGGISKHPLDIGLAQGDEVTGDHGQYGKHPEER